MELVQGSLFGDVPVVRDRRPRFLRPFFSYYGGKWRSAPWYPRPRFPRIVEPFAGSAGYSLRHYRRDVVLYEVDPIVAGLWAYLIRVRPEEVLALPERVETVEDVKGPQEARWLVGFNLSKASTSPCPRPSAWMRGEISLGEFWGDRRRATIARQVKHIRHWRIVDASYASIPLERATWYVDPPYCGPAGRHYRRSNIDYPTLAAWCRTLPGQTIVCEQQGADWLPFEPLGTFKATGGKNRKQTVQEAIWTNERGPAGPLGG